MTNDPPSTDTDRDDEWAFEEGATIREKNTSHLKMHEPVVMKRLTDEDGKRYYWIEYEPGDYALKTAEFLEDSYDAVSGE